ncbi:MAG: hypothetical protein KGL40_07055 [Rhodocyclaceae bacterium]|nr:hypothetical protein [Rhodocyclaceae bacterium]
MTAPRNDNAPGHGGESAQQSNLLAEFCYPDPNSVKGRVLGAHLRGERLSHLDCWLRFGSARLSHHIYVLRGLGWPIDMREETVKTSDAGRPATIGIYSLPESAIQRAGARGRQYAEETARVEIERKAA